MAKTKDINMTVITTDMDIAVSFYTKVLGLNLKKGHGNAWTKIEEPGVSIEFRQVVKTQTDE